MRQTMHDLPVRHRTIESLLVTLPTLGRPAATARLATGTEPAPMALTTRRPMLCPLPG